MTDGVYSRLRHPRFLGMALAVAAMALLTNFATIYALFALYVVAILQIARLEERELLERFGSRYAAPKASSREPAPTPPVVL